VAQPGSGLTAPDQPGPGEILAALNTALLVVDPEDIVRDVNAAAEMLLNASAVHLVGERLADVMPLPFAYAEAKGGVFAAYDMPFVNRRGGRFRADFHANPFPDRPGWTLVSLSAGAGAQHMGNRLERRSGAKAAVGIAAMLAHEIKNPLSGIRGAAQLLESRAAPDDVAMTRLIRTEVDRVAALIDRMEGFTDTRPLALAPDNIHEIIDHARSVAERGFGANLKITDSYDPSLPAVLVHRDSLIQVILNLLKNAAETSDGAVKRKVTLTTGYRHGVAVSVEGEPRRRALPIELCVIDDGPGAPPDLAESLFDPFVSSKKAGRGLGLALVDKLVRDMGGIIQYAREGQPEHTVFRLLLPRAERTKQ
jgi:two-component system, NtrC family, nitrogen regulation sensor histidine kinase GlnL